MPIVAGTLNIISGSVQLLVAIGAFLWLYSGEGFTEYEYSPEYTPEGYLLRFFIPFFISGVLAIGGGINAVKRDKMLGLVWAGAIAASFPLLISWSFLSEMFALVFGNKTYMLTGLLGIVSLILIGQYEIDLIEKCQVGIRAIWENWLRIVQRWWTEKTKMQRTRSIVFIVIVLALLTRGMIWGIPFPLCGDYYTSTSFRLNNIPDPDKFANLLEQDEWKILSRDWFSGGDGRGRVLAEKETWAFFSKPRIQVRLFSKYYISEEGSIKVTIADGSGNRIANRLVFNDFVKKTNDNFSLNLSYDGYNYIRYCD